MQVMEERPPYVRFEQRAVVDAAKTQETGLTQYKDVDFVMVTSAGGKDTHEERAEKWLEKQRLNVKHDRIPPTHLEYYERLYDSYCKGKELPENGIPIKMWPSASPAQQQQILQANIRTVEDLANANEDALQRIGMGGRALKQKAIAYIQSSETGKGAAEINSLRVQLEEEKRKNEALESQLNELAAKVDQLTAPKKRGRPKKNEPADGNPKDV